MNRIFKKLIFTFVLSALIICMCLPETWAAGLLKPLDGSAADVSMKSHHVDVIINNGYVRTEVDQIFINTGDRDLEAIYSFPIPKQGSLSEVSLWIDGQEVVGEVLEKESARKTYEDQKARGNDTALAEKDDYKTFDVRVYPVRAQDETRVRLVYYQPLSIDLNIGRYVYQIEEGGVDDERIAFWSVDDMVRGSFKFNLRLKSAFPVKDIRLPGYQDQAAIKKVSPIDQSSGEGEIYEASLEFPEGASLSRDILFYYRLDDDVPARVELIPYREDPAHPGTFMAVVTPGASLQRIADGTDWNFVLDKSGSMSGDKIDTLANGVCKVINKMSPLDRFRIITFDSSAYDFTGGYIQATPENVYSAIERIKTIQADGSTALYEGLRKAYKGLDEGRVTGIILVTDGVANVGPTQQSHFRDLLRNYDVRLFTFVMGNSANEPLLEMLAKESGGFAMNISSNDDIIGRIIQAQAKVLHECIYDVELNFSGEKVQDLTPVKIGNLFMGQQLVCFGRYNGSGEVELELKGRIAGNEEVWSCKAFLPEKDTDNPELERLWALSSIEDIMAEIREKGEKEALRQRIVDMGTHFSLVTDYTSMLVIREDEMESLGIKKRNAQRVSAERQAQATRDLCPIKNYRVDTDPGRQGGSAPSGTGMFGGARAHKIGTGPVGLLFLGIAAWIRRRRLRQ